MSNLFRTPSIARFLDHTTGLIDRYKWDGKLMALLEEQKRLTVHDAVVDEISVRAGRLDVRDAVNRFPELRVVADCVGSDDVRCETSSRESILKERSDTP